MHGLLQARADAFVRRQGAMGMRYDADGLGAPASVTVLVTNARSLPLAGVRGDRLAGRVLSGTTLLPGHILWVPGLGSGWFLVGHSLQSTLSPVRTMATTYALLALPYQLTTRRATRGAATVQPSALDAWDEPVGLTQSGTVNEQEDTGMIRVGFSNQANPLALAAEGVMPAGSTTLYAPLGANVKKGDEIRAADVRDANGAALPLTALPPLEAAYTVTQVNHLFADGTPYGLQALLSSATGSGT